MSASEEANWALRSAPSALQELDYGADRTEVRLGDGPAASVHLKRHFASRCADGMGASPRQRDCGWRIYRGR